MCCRPDFGGSGFAIGEFRARVKRWENPKMGVFTDVFVADDVKNFLDRHCRIN